MILERIKDNVASNVNKSLHFIYNGSRNQIEEFDGKIICLYKYIFLIKVNQSEIIKSFSYSDVLIGSLVINTQ